MDCCNEIRDRPRDKASRSPLEPVFVAVISAAVVERGNSTEHSVM